MAGRWSASLHALSGSGNSIPEAKPTRSLTGPQLETLAIIAYRQLRHPRGLRRHVRGVAVDGVMQVLLDRGLVKIAGRADVPGRPLLYSTTEYFLQHFGLKSTDELPNASEVEAGERCQRAGAREPAAAPAAPDGTRRSPATETNVADAIPPEDATQPAETDAVASTEAEAPVAEEPATSESAGDSPDSEAAVEEAAAPEAEDTPPAPPA